jgi:hypothetical protein
VAGFMKNEAQLAHGNPSIFPQGCG